MKLIDTTTSVPDAASARSCPHGGHSTEDVCVSIDEIQSRLDTGETRMDRIEAKIDDNSTDTAEILDILRLGKSFFRVIGYFGSFMKWFAAIAAPVLVFWYTIKNGGKL